MDDLVHNFASRKRKRGASFRQAVDATVEVASEASEPPSNGRSDLQEIVILGSPEMGFHSQPALENATMMESGDASPTPAAIQVVLHPEQTASQSDRAKYT